MCGRFAIAANLEQIVARFQATISDDGLWNWQANYNISPGMVVPVMAYSGRQKRRIVPMRWGLHPHWKKTPPEGRPLFNARVETAADKPSFRTPFRRRRALIPVSGWYEWEGVERPKTPYFIHDKDKPMTALAGLWDQWRVDEGITLLTMTILTTAVSGPVKRLHHRMPVRLPETRWNDWLSWDHKPERVLAHIKGGDDLEFYEVARVVGSGRAEGPDLIKPIQD